ncbi:MAG: hypothetical protein APF78_07730 [Sphingomonadales bacterium BRH_c3]|nr:MAG: hypothetical protein APF78_07730 [Sphingomonadales bacterium BRH_c3]
MPAKIETIPGSAPNILGEGALWDKTSGCLWWVDIKGNALFRFDVEVPKLRSWPTPEWITRVIPTGRDGHLIGTLSNSFCRINAVNTRLEIEPIYSLDHGETRFNDGALDPQGEYWAGTMPMSEDEPVGKWMRLGMDGQVDVLDTPGFTVTNGPAFDAKNRLVYLTDSVARCIYRATFDPERGIRELIKWRCFNSEEGCPDGMEIGPDGLLWIAFWDGGCLRALNDRGVVTRRVDLPVIRPTSVSFRSESILYVTSAAFGTKQDGMQGMTLQVMLDG